MAKSPDATMAKAKSSGPKVGGARQTVSGRRSVTLLVVAGELFGVDGVPMASVYRLVGGRGWAKKKKKKLCRLVGCPHATEATLLAREGGPTATEQQSSKGSGG